jgi:HEAT repeats
MAQPDWIALIAKQISRANDKKPKTDWWQRATVISGFLSSVVIAGVGIIISFTVQKAQLTSSKAAADAQIEVARLKNENDSREEENKLAADLIQHLLSENSNHRILAIQILRHSVPAEEYVELVGTVAAADKDSSVRQAAIVQLGKMKTGPNEALFQEVTDTLRQISTDKTVTSAERELAAESETNLFKARADAFKRTLELQNTASALRLKCSLKQVLIQDLKIIGLNSVGSSSLKLFEGDNFKLEVTNSSPIPLYIVVLNLPASGKISALSQKATFLRPQEVLDTAVLRVGPPFGSEHLKVIGSTEFISLSGLADSSLVQKTQLSLSDLLSHNSGNPLSFPPNLDWTTCQCDYTSISR